MTKLFKHIRSYNQSDYSEYVVCEYQCKLCPHISIHESSDFFEFSFDDDSNGEFEPSHKLYAISKHLKECHATNCYVCNICLELYIIKRNMLQCKKDHISDDSD